MRGSTVGAALVTVVLATAPGVGIGTATAATRPGAELDAPTPGRYIYDFTPGIIPETPSGGHGVTVFDPSTGTWNTKVATSFLAPLVPYTIVAQDLDGGRQTEICSYVNDATGSGGCGAQGHELRSIEKIVSRLDAPIFDQFEPAMARQPAQPDGLVEDGEIERVD